MAQTIAPSSSASGCDTLPERRRRLIGKGKPPPPGLRRTWQCHQPIDLLLGENPMMSTRACLHDAFTQLPWNVLLSRALFVVAAKA